MGEIIVRFIVYLILVCSLVPINALAQTEKLEVLKTDRGATIKYVLIKPKNPKATLILIPGGAGNLKLENKVPKNWALKKGNFLVRIRRKLAANNLIVAIIDAPSDKSSLGFHYRTTNAHAKDIRLLAKQLKKKYNHPLWLVGTSRGTISAARSAIAKIGEGVIFTASITNARKVKNKKFRKNFPNGIASLNLGKIKTPVLILSHKNDGCRLSPPSDSKKIEARLKNASTVKNVILSGGKKPNSDPCKALSPHGFYGIEDRATKIIVDFIENN